VAAYARDDDPDMGDCAADDENGTAGAASTVMAGPDTRRRAAAGLDRCVDEGGRGIMISDLPHRRGRPSMDPELSANAVVEVYC